MNSPRDRDPDRQLQFLRELLEEDASIDGDVLKIGIHTWAIHGDIPVDGEVLAAQVVVPQLLAVDAGAGDGDAAAPGERARRAWP